MSLGARFRSALRRAPGAAFARLVRLNWLARTSAHQDFSAFLQPDAEWRAALQSAVNGKRVLIATSMGGHFALSAIDRLLAAALTLRDAAATTLLCDAALPACQMTEFNLTPDVGAFVRDGPDPLLCGYCHAPAAARIGALGSEAARMSAFLTPAARAEAAARARDTPVDAIGALKWRGMAVGEHATAGALRFFARGDFDAEPHGEAVLRRYLESALLAGGAYLNAIERLAPDVVVAHHGIYTPQGLAVAAAKAAGVRVATWNPAYRRGCFIFSHDDTYHHTLMDEPSGAWRDKLLSEAERAETLAYLHSRRTGERDWIRFHRDPDLANAHSAALGLDPAKPYALALTNVFWDAQLHYPANAFASQLHWLIDTVEWFAARPELQLVIRVHPAEVSGSPASRQFAAREVAKRFPNLPPNVRLVPPESALSTYKLADGADVALIYATKMGVELSALGLPVIVAGEAWVRGKGFTLDARSPEDYRARLAALPLRRRLSAEETDLAIRYARHFFFRRMIELPFVEETPGARRFTIGARSLADLQPGASSGLDVICAGILTGAPFLAAR